MPPDNEAGPGGWVPGPSGDESRMQGATSRPTVPTAGDYATSPRCDPAACVMGQLALADLLARYRVSAASRDVADAMVSSGLLDKVTAAIGQPVGPDAWIAFYEKRAAELAEKLEPRRRELRAGRAPGPAAASDFDNAEHRGAAEMRQRLADRADRLGITDLDVRHPGWNGRAGLRAQGLRLEGDHAPRVRDATVTDIGEARRG